MCAWAQILSQGGGQDVYGEMRHTASGGGPKPPTMGRGGALTPQGGAVTIYWTWAYARACVGSEALLLPLSGLLGRGPNASRAGRCTVDEPLHPHLSACLVAVALTYAGLQTNIS